jgi:hypothetical protein
LAGLLALYRRAGLDLRRHLAQLTRTADITADPPAARWLIRTSTVSGEAVASVVPAARTPPSGVKAIP